MLKEFVVTVFVQFYQVLVFVQLADAEDCVDQCLVIKLSHILFDLSKHRFVFHLGKELFVKVAWSDAATCSELLNESGSDKRDVREVWLGDIEQ